MIIKSKTGILLLALLFSCISLQAQDADCPCWGEKKAFVAEVYSFNGIGKVESHLDPQRLLIIPGFSAGLKFNKKNTFMIGFNYVELNHIYDGPVYCVFAGFCPDCMDTKIIEPLVEWKYLTLWKKNFRTEIFARLGPDIIFYEKNYYLENPSDNAVENKVHFYKSSIAAGYNFFFKISKHYDFCVSPFFQYFIHNNDYYKGHYDFFGGIKAGLKYSKYAK